jgi:hypothetical protein
MSQQTNLNVAPYFDDSDANDDYYKILFKPGYPIQARELTGLQSILQNQIKKFGQHFFKEGAKVIPGNTSYNQFYNAVELSNNFLGIPVAAYAETLIGMTITGQTSGVTALVDNVLLPSDSERGNLTLYVRYVRSNTQDNITETFSDGENLVSNTTIETGLLGNTSISSGSPFGSTISNNATSSGTVFLILEGVYFFRGQFVNVKEEKLILSQYTTNTNARVGFFINEEIINSDLDENLNDNSQGYSNYAAPGADRMKITVSLFKKDLTDFDDTNFVELARIVDGNLKVKPQTTDKSVIAEELAKRTYEESGDYTVSPFEISVKDSLNDKKGNRGIYRDGQFTYSGSTPDEELALYKISSGKAFVKGYRVETNGAIYLDSEKPRTTKTLKDQSIVYNTGPTFGLNNIYGSPKIGIGNTFVLSLRDQRVGSAATIASGSEIGVARVYDFRLESGSYSLSNQNLNDWEIGLYDVQYTTDITLNYPVTLSTPTHIKGENSGATGYLLNSVTDSRSIQVYNTEGSFIPNESFSFNGESVGYVGAALTANNSSNIKSVHGVVGSGITFSADVIQSDRYIIGIATVSALDAGISTITSLNDVFPGTLVRYNDIIKYTDNSLGNPVFARVTEVGTNSVKVAQVETVVGVTSSSLPSTQLDITDLTVMASNLDISTDNTLFTQLPKENISDVDLTTSTLTIRKEFTVNIANNQLSVALSAGTNETFLPFDEERYSLVRSDGSYEALTSDMFALISGGSQLQINNLGTDNIGATLIATLRKSNTKAKDKKKNRVSSIVISASKLAGSGIGATTLNDGLVYGTFPFGTRVQDNTICLNVPDIVDIHAIYESANTSDPTPPKAILSSITTPSSTTSEFIIGEEIHGQSSGACAIIASKISSTQISFIYRNKNTFTEGETIFSYESDSTSIVQTLSADSFDVSSNFSYKTGQKGTFYDYGTIVRNSDVQEPTKKLIIYYSGGYYDSSDDGDITTVNSYANGFDYTNEIRTVNFIRNSDIIDIRPRVSDFTTEQSLLRSPLEFHGRSFNSSGNSSANILASDESIQATFSFFLGRIDRIFLTKDGVFQVKYGTPSERPEKPVSVDDSLEIATINLPPYLYKTSDAEIEFLDHKRYKMSDIQNLERRIKSLEYYTSLSLLETNTANLFVPDSEGLVRFKSGFFVDNFTSLLAQEPTILFKNSIDIKNKELRPSHYTNAIDLIPGPVVGFDPSTDRSTSQPEGINIRKSSDIITLDYSEVEYLTQKFGTRVESVTPFILNFWRGSISLTPASDVWVDTVRLEAKFINVEGNYARVLRDAVENLNIDPQTGFAPTVWNSWVDNWTGQERVTRTQTRTTTNWLGWGIRWDTIQDQLLDVVDTGISNRNGTRATFSEQIDNTSVGDRVVSRDLIPFMRSRNIAFMGNGLKPNTRVYAFFDGVDVTNYCVPKLIEISMTSGVFQVGETVTGRVINTGLGPDTLDISPRIEFRVAQKNHRTGSYDVPVLTYPENPYTTTPLTSTYSSTSTILNVDTNSLSNIAEGTFSGFIQQGMVLVGGTSGAQATVSAVRFVSDITATVAGSFFVPNPNITVNPRFETGSKSFTLINDEDGDVDDATTLANESFEASGTLETVQENIVSVRNARVTQTQQNQSRDIRRVADTQVVSSTVVNTRTWAFPPPPPPPPPRRPPPRPPRRWDPLAQSFFVEELEGIFVTKCGVYFNTTDAGSTPVVLQLRTLELGTPSEKVLPLSEVFLFPNQITTSDDGSAITFFEFDAPVYLKGETEYAVVMLSQSADYSVFISRVGENDILTQSFVSNQPTLGSLFKSQNASTWEPSQWEDLKFDLYRADFLDTGTIDFYNPELTSGNNQIANLLPNTIEMNSKKVRISLASTIGDTTLEFGNTIMQWGSDATGNYVGNAGIATGNLNIINAGIGYTPGSGQFIFGGVVLDTISGKGSGATADVTVKDGVAIAATISATGNGYVAGDVLSIPNIGSLEVGRNARFSIVSIANTNQLIVDNIQGDFLTGVANTMRYVSSVGITTNLNWELGGNVSVDTITTVSDGLHIKVNHKNHGMYSEEDYVKISDVASDIRPSKLSINYSSDSTGAIQISDANEFSTFEGVGVGTTNPGYIKIGNEIIEYTSVNGNDIQGNIVRGSNPLSYSVGTPVYKYELNGVSLKRINKVHNLSNVSVSDPITFDSYNIKLDMSLDGTNRTVAGYPKLYQGLTKTSGGYNAKATQNIPFEIITPIVQNLTVPGTTIGASIRSVTGKSIDGKEIPFIDSGFDPITVNSANYLDEPRIVCSKVNEDEKLALLTGNKSMNMRLTLATTNPLLSPVIDSQRVAVILTSNRVNKVITDYSTDSRVSSATEDPSAFQYISKEIGLESPATSLKILLNAHVNNYSDIRAFYAIGDNPNFDPLFFPFPGYDNLDYKNQIIKLEDSDGKPDKFVVPSNELGFESQQINFKEYSFTADELPAFRSYRIKLVMTSTSQAFVPRVKDLRVIALA